MPSWEEKKTTNLLSALKKSVETSPESLLTALGIRFVGKRTAQTLIKNFNSIDGILDAERDNIENIHGISKSVSESIFEWKSNKNNIELIETLKDSGFKFDKKNTSSKSFLAGNTFVITGTLETYTRQEIVDLIENLGGTVTTAVSKNTNYLIYGSNPGSKYDKANSLNIDLLDEVNVKDLISKYKKSN